jgi:hypothetical protein
MAAVPPWLIGKHVTTVTAQLQSVSPVDGTLGNLGTGSPEIATLAAGTGKLSLGTFAFTTGLVDAIEYNGAKTTENIAAINETHANAVPIARRDSFTLTEILRTGAGNSLLAALWTAGTSDTNASRIVGLTFNRGAKGWSGYFLMTGYTESIRRGKSTARMTLEMVDPGQTNAAYAASGDYS